jgi:membrane protease YdiL (CAAX protease family)
MKIKIQPWKLWMHFAGYFFCFVIAGLIAAIPRFIVGFENESGLIILITELLRIPITITLFFYYTVYISKIPLNRKTLKYSSFAPLKWGIIGFLLPLVVLSIFYITGNLTVIETNFQISHNILVDNILKALGMSLAAGIIEEVLFRGYLVNLLNNRYSFWFSAIIPSFLFALVHIGGADTLLNSIQLIVAGVFVSIMFLLIYKKTGSIWNASIVHFLWNFLNFNELVDYGKSNEPFYKMVELDLGGNDLFNGGASGIEASIPAIILYITVILIIYNISKRNKKTSLLM